MSRPPGTILLSLKEIETIRKMALEGCSVIEISREVHRSVSTVHVWKKKLNLIK